MCVTGLFYLFYSSPINAFASFLREALGIMGLLHTAYQILLVWEL